MSTITLPIEDAHLERARHTAEKQGMTPEQLLADKMRSYCEELPPARSRAEIEEEFRAQLANMSPEEWDDIDPEVEAVAGLLTKEIPEDYWEIVVEKYL